MPAWGYVTSEPCTKLTLCQDRKMAKTSEPLLGPDTTDFDADAHRCEVVYQALFQFRHDSIFVQVDALAFDGLLESLYEDVIQRLVTTIHADAGFHSFQARYFRHTIAEVMPTLAAV